MKRRPHKVAEDLPGVRVYGRSEIPEVNHMSQYNVIGKNVPRVDAAAKVNGTAIYCDDVYFRNTVYGKLVHSPFAHAKILSIDISAALALPGVVTVLLAKDIPDNRTIGEEHGWLLAEKEVCYIGDPVALVQAASGRIGEEAGRIGVATSRKPSAVMAARKAETTWQRSMMLAFTSGLRRSR